MRFRPTGSVRCVRHRCGDGKTGPLVVVEIQPFENVTGARVAPATVVGSGGGLDVAYLDSPEMEPLTLHADSSTNSRTELQIGKVEHGHFIYSMKGCETAIFI